jgi:hypothetical protein
MFEQFEALFDAQWVGRFFAAHFGTLPLRDHAMHEVRSRSAGAFR